MDSRFLDNGTWISKLPKQIFAGFWDPKYVTCSEKKKRQKIKLVMTSPSLYGNADKIIVSSQSNGETTNP